MAQKKIPVEQSDKYGIMVWDDGDHITIQQLCNFVAVEKKNIQALIAALQTMEGK